MSSGDRDHDHPIRADEARELAANLARPDIQAAIAAYTQTDETHDCPDLGGSDNAGRTIIFDQGFVSAIKAGRFKYEGQPFDPRPFLRIHEAVEGALIRLLGYDYDRAHLQATIAERQAVEKAGMVWAKYQQAFQPFIRATESERDGNWPPDLLLAPYKGTSIFDKLEAAQRSSIEVPMQSSTYQPQPPAKPGAADSQPASKPSSAQELNHHRLAIGGAHHMHEAGYISKEQKDQVQASARAKLAAAKPAAEQSKPMAAPPMRKPQETQRKPMERPFGSLGGM